MLRWYKGAQSVLRIYSPTPLHHHQPEPVTWGRMGPCFHVLFTGAFLSSEPACPFSSTHVLHAGHFLLILIHSLSTREKVVCENPSRLAVSETLRPARLVSKSSHIQSHLNALSSSFWLLVLTSASCLDHIYMPWPCQHSWDALPVIAVIHLVLDEDPSTEDKSPRCTQLHALAGATFSHLSHKIWWAF